MIMYSLRLNDETYLKIKLIADNQQRSVNRQIEHTIKQFIKEYEKSNGEINLNNKTKKSI